VRQAVEAELRSPVVAPGEAAASRADEVLVVEVDGGEIRMLLLGRGSGVVARTIPAPPDRGARLQAIAWLAGNVVRDQMSRFLPPMGVEPGVAVASPPSSACPPPAAAAPVVTAAAARTAPAATGADPAWFVTAAAGPTATLFNMADENHILGRGRVLYDMEYELSVQRRLSPGWLALGLGVDVGTGLGDSPSPHVLGGAALLGASWRFHVWSLEATAGLGVERVRVVAPDIVDFAAPGAPPGYVPPYVLTSDIKTTPYGRLATTAVVPLGRTLAVVAGLGLHATAAGRYTDFGTVTAGVRVFLP
jgi:hypothetical protein